VVEFLLVAMAACVVANMAIARSFIQALQREAPQVLASIAFSPGRADARLRYWRLVLLRGYRIRLAACPVSRAWASWLFVLHWLQLASVAGCMLLVAAR
jgi:hypothetical protein